MSFTWMFALMGALQGGLLYGLLQLQERKLWLATEPPLFTGLFYAAVALPLLFYCTQNVEGVPPKVRRLAVLLLGLLFAALGAGIAWSAGSNRESSGGRFPDALVVAVLGFVLLGLFCGYDFRTRRWHYTRHFSYAWRNGILLVTAAVMVGIFWCVLWAGAGLMSLIGVGWVSGLIRQPAFVYPVTGLVVAGAVGQGLVRAGMTETIRRYTLSIAAWLLPLVLFFAVLWTLALPFTGLAPLFETRYASRLMLGFTALAVLFANCAYQDGEHDAYPGWLASALQGAWLALLAVVGVAWWALGLRVRQYGWSEDRLWAALVGLLAAVYAVGYALSWGKRERTRWMQAMGATNIVAALLLCAGLLVYMAPPTHVRKLAVAAHLEHVRQAVAGADGKAAEPDWAYLRWDAGRYGRQALQAIAARQGVLGGMGWERQAERVLAQTDRYEQEPENQMNTQEMAAKLHVYPRGKSLPEAFVAQLRSDPMGSELRRCLLKAEGCAVWRGDLDGDTREELVVFQGSWNGALYVQSAEGRRRAGRLWTERGNGRWDQAELERAQTVPPKWRDLEVQGQRLQVGQ